MSRAKITAQDDRHVTITFTDLQRDKQITMEIWAPRPKDGGASYVRYNDYNDYNDYNGDKQLCDKLFPLGNTLIYTDGTKLIDIVRREYKARRAADKRAITCCTR